MGRPVILPGQTLLLVVTIAVTALLTAMICHSVPKELQAAKASEETNGIVAFPVQVSRQSDGLAIVDTTNCNICVYQLQAQRPAQERLVLVAARSFRYDRQLDDYNTLPHPADVEDMLRRAALLDVERDVEAGERSQDAGQ